MIANGRCPTRTEKLEPMLVRTLLNNKMIDKGLLYIFRTMKEDVSSYCEVEDYLY